MRTLSGSIITIVLASMVSFTAFAAGDIIVKKWRVSGSGEIAVYSPDGATKSKIKAPDLGDGVSATQTGDLGLFKLVTKEGKTIYFDLRTVKDYETPKDRLLDRKNHSKTSTDRERATPGFGDRSGGNE